MSNIELRKHVYCAVLMVPKDVQPVLGKTKFRKSLGTSNKLEAERLGAPYLANWKAQIKQARGHSGALVAEALRWKQAFKVQDEMAGGEAGKEEMLDHLIERARELEQTEGKEAGDKLWGIVHGTRKLSANYFEPWKAQLDLSPKTNDQMAKDVGRLLVRFPTLEDITRRNAKRWLGELAAEGLSTKTLQRNISFYRNFWKYLQRHDAVAEDVDPFTNILQAVGTKKPSNGNGSWLPLSPTNVVRLWEKAGTEGDCQLADLIALAAFTGARIHELCAVKVTDIGGDSFKIVDSKTTAGIREVPIHSSLVSVVGRLKSTSKDGYLLSGLTVDKYGKRSNALGKRFGRLKADMGFTEGHVFHSIRKTLTTLLEDMGVSENLAADIVGHEKPRITYGLYSGGASLATKRDAIEKVSYPFPAGSP